MKVFPFWQMGKVEKNRFSLYGKPLVIRTGTSDVSVFQAVFLEDDFDLSFLHLKPKLILDLGANVGYTSIFFAHTYPQSRVFAVEPEESNFKVLKENAAPYENIVLFQAAIWNKRTKLQITNSNAEKCGFQVSESKNKPVSSTVDALTIDELLAEANSNEIDILKVDIEGAEIELFSSNFENWLGKSNVIMIELHDRFRKGCSEIFNAAVKNYDFYRINKGEHTILTKKITLSSLFV
jgi:FkbM family methyltransferase